MTPVVSMIDRTEALRLISYSFDHIVSEDRKRVLSQAVRISDPLWKAEAGGEVLCLYGLTAPTMLADYAYLWLHTTPAMKTHVIGFLRASRAAIAEMLEHYPLLIGHGTEGDERSLDWLRFLGAKIAPDHTFEIRAPHG